MSELLSPVVAEEQRSPLQPDRVELADRQKVLIKTYGCQMNVYDSEQMGDALAGDGYEVTGKIEEANLILLNTCHIREKAAEKVYSDIGRFRKFKEDKAAIGQKLVIGVTGCVAQAEGKEILHRARAVDLVVGPQTYHRLPEIVARALNGERVVDTEYATEDKFEYLPNSEPSQIIKRGVTAFLTIQEGCDKFCTFCVVPYTRGSEQSRSVKQIVDEAKRLILSGVREITLLGQNVNAWHGQGPDGNEWGLGDLLFELAKLSGLDRLRYTTSHPIDMSENSKDRLIAAHRDLDIVMPYLHLPVQSGSSRILKAMNRHHTADDYLRAIDRFRAVRPDIAISGDFIVGFPGESEDDFYLTLDLIRQVKYASAFSFRYSSRPGTPGALMKETVSLETASERLQELQALLNMQQYDFNKQCVEKTMNVLVEKPGKRPGQLIARSPWLQSVILNNGTDDIGDIVPVKIIEGSPNSLIGIRV
ncbi:MAG: tRNA (N6-isopentenyl adenosine(37)-C2)-methylthiotransferase MiaB [Hyphomicrobiales bacterium]|nr:tRNA (N6-isopentenyl adenosine(37)-C2)-methylthiotransferase MiaB [Hyphomicrobiales bacterium]